MAKKPNQQAWDRLVREWKTSQLTQSEFCRKKGIKPHQLNYQLSKRRDEATPKQPAKRDFVHVRSAPVVSTPATEIAVDGRIAIRLGGVPDPQWVAGIVREMLKLQ